MTMTTMMVVLLIMMIVSDDDDDDDVIFYFLMAAFSRRELRFDRISAFSFLGLVGPHVGLRPSGEGDGHGVHTASLPS